MTDDLPAHIASLTRYALMLCRNPWDAEDLVQETLTKAIAAADTFQSGRELRPWLFGILHNVYFSEQRHYARRARAASFLDDAGAETGSPVEQEKHLEAQDTVRLIRRLSPEHQTVLILIAVEGMSYEAAAQALGIPVGTLMSRLARARERLRKLVSGTSTSRLKAVR